MKNKILVPTDFSPAAGKAVAQAVELAKKLDTGIILLSVMMDEARPAELVEMDLNAERAKIRKRDGIAVRNRFLKGSFLQSMVKYTCENDHCLMVVGTHGIHGLKQRLLGPDILKLVSKVRMPALGRFRNLHR